MSLFKDETSKNDIWEKKDLLECTYEPGMFAGLIRYLSDNK